MVDNVKMQRGYIALEDGEFDAAIRYFDGALNDNPYEASAYWGLMLCDLFCVDNAELSKLGIDFTDNKNYQKALRYADDKQKAEYQSITRSAIENGQKKIIELLKKSDYKTAYLRIKNSAKQKLTFPEAVANLYYITDGFQDIYVKSRILDSAIKHLENATDHKDLFEKTANDIHIFELIGKFTADIEEHEEQLRKKEEENLRKLEAERKRKEEERLKREAEEKRKLAEEEEQKRISERKKRKRKRITISLISLVIVFVILLFAVIIPSMKYAEAKELMKTGNYEEARIIFDSILFKDSIELSKECKIVIADEKFEIQYDKLKSAKPGDTVTYGYAATDEWESVNANGEIEWIVLDSQNGKLLLLTKTSLYQDYYKKYADYYDDVPWEDSGIRRDLERKFFEDAFIGKTASHVMDTETSEGIYDRIFLLSYDQVVKYFGIDEYDCASSDIGILSGRAAYWIRSSESGENKQSLVYSEGSIGSHSPNFRWHVRPAIWVDISE